MRWITHSVVILLIAGCSENSQRLAATENHCKPIVAVYPVWNHSDKNLSQLPWTSFSHIGIASIYPLASGELETKDADKFIDELVATAHEHKKQVIVSIGGAAHASKGFLTIANDDNLMRTFSNNVKKYVDKHNLDGVDIDWEYWSYQNEQNKGGNDPKESVQLVNLMKVLRNTLSSEKILSVDIAAGYWLGEQYLPELQDYVDYVNLMAFDFTGAWSESPIAYHSRYSDFKKAILYSLEKGFKAEKLIVGIPAYGIEFKDGKNEAVEHIAYNKIVDRLKGNEDLLDKGRIDNIYFETAKNAKRKARFLIDKNLAGAFLFEINSDTKLQSKSIALALAESFGVQSCSVSY